jgi:hypothetical protein
MHRNFWCNHTRKPNKFAKNETVDDQFSMVSDYDELQLLDECDSEWVEAWKEAAKQLSELMVHVFAPPEQERRLVERKKRR